MNQLRFLAGGAFSIPVSQGSASVSSGGLAAILDDMEENGHEISLGRSSPLGKFGPSFMT